MQACLWLSKLSGDKPIWYPFCMIRVDLMSPRPQNTSHINLCITVPPVVGIGLKIGSCQNLMGNSLNVSIRTGAAVLQNYVYTNVGGKSFQHIYCRQFETNKSFQHRYVYEISSVKSISFYWCDLVSRAAIHANASETAGVRLEKRAVPGLAGIPWSNKHVKSFQKL